ncbi:FAD binding domain-containing protein [Actinoplanes sp. GCM10030250]|uniref:FAD binding domain-containing protein n=1 Tax=Actinoplanes sp. GCM10030250 TaxID=3273376 RepID=UPI0036107CEC
MKTAAFEYLAASSVDEVLAELADGEASVLAGGQSLVLDVTKQDAAHRRVVDINRVAGLDTLVEEDGSLRVGALVRHRTFESEAVGGALGDLLRVVVRHIGHPPIRARGTMLGSFAYAHPAAEWPAMAVTLGARLVLAGSQGSRTVSAESFFTGPYTTARRPDELLIEARLPTLPAGTYTGYAEDRRTSIYPQAAAMAAITVTGGLITAARIGLVNAGPCPVRARAAENILVGSTFCDAAILAAADAAAMMDAPFPGCAEADLKARQRAVRLQTRRALSQVRERM